MVGNLLGLNGLTDDNQTLRLGLGFHPTSSAQKQCGRHDRPHFVSLRRYRRIGNTWGRQGRVFSPDQRQDLLVGCGFRAPASSQAQNRGGQRERDNE